MCMHSPANQRFGSLYVEISVCVGMYALLANFIHAGMGFNNSIVYSEQFIEKTARNLRQEIRTRRLASAVTRRCPRSVIKVTQGQR